MFVYGTFTASVPPIYSPHLTSLKSFIVKKKLRSVFLRLSSYFFYFSYFFLFFLLFMINFVITMAKFTRGSTVNFDSVMMQFILNN